MNRTTNADDDDDDLPSEIDFSNAKCDPDRFAWLAGRTLVKLDRDIAEVFDSSQEVNTALSQLLHLSPPEYPERAEQLGPERKHSTKLPPIPPQLLVTMIAIENDIMKVLVTPEKVNAALRTLMDAKSVRKKSA